MGEDRQMNEPKNHDVTDQIDDLSIIAKLLTALENQEEMVEDVKRLGLGQRTIRWIVAVMGLLIAASITVGGWASHSAADADESAENVAELVEQLEQDRLARAEESCKIRNYFQQNTRAKFAAQYDIFQELVTTPEGQAVVDELRKSIGTPEEEDRDCTGDGELNGRDYLVGDLTTTED